MMSIDFLNTDTLFTELLQNKSYISANYMNHFALDDRFCINEKQQSFA